MLSKYTLGMITSAFVQTALFPTQRKTYYFSKKKKKKFLNSEQ